MRRLLSTLALAFLVIFAQAGALVHECSHGLGHASANTAVAGDTDTQDQGAGGHGSYCDKCFQFAHIAGTVFSSAPASVLLVVGASRVTGGFLAELAADAPISRSRGPPTNL